MTTLSIRDGWAGEVTDLVRAASGGLLFGVPLLYTVEVTWTGQHTDPLQALLVLGVCFGLLTILNRTSGFRSSADNTLREAAMDAVEGVALAIVVVLVVLVVLGEISRSTPLAVVLGKMAYEVLPVSVGIGVANNLLREPTDGDTGQRSSRAPALDATVADLGATAFGALVVALSIAPTDEVPMLASTRSPLWLLAIVAMSLLVAYAIVFEAGFVGQSRRRSGSGLLQHPVIETFACYVVALLIAYLLLALFQRGDAPWQITLGQVIVLGFPASIGGAAGRLAL